MATAAALMAIIAASSGPTDFPARIGTTAAALSDIAGARFQANSNLLALCQNLEASTSSLLDGGRQNLGDDDARVLSFFLAANSALRELTCAKAFATLQRCRGAGDAHTGPRRLGWNQIGDAGVAAIAEALMTNAALERIEYGTGWMAIPGFDGGAPVLTMLPRLGGNVIADAGATKIAEALKTNNALGVLGCAWFRQRTASGHSCCCGTQLKH